MYDVERKSVLKHGFKSFVRVSTVKEFPYVV